MAAKKGSVQDSRELFLMVEGEDWADTTNCDAGKEGKRVREFAQVVNLAARNVERVLATRAESVAQLRSRLAAVERDRAAVDTAEADLARLKPPVDEFQPVT